MALHRQLGYPGCISRSVQARKKARIWSRQRCRIKPVRNSDINMASCRLRLCTVEGRKHQGRFAVSQHNACSRSLVSPLSLTTARVMPLSAPESPQKAGSAKKRRMAGGEERRRPGADTTVARCHALTRRLRIRERPRTGRWKVSSCRAAPARAALRAPRSVGRIASDRWWLLRVTFLSPYAL